MRDLALSFARSHFWNVPIRSQPISGNYCPIIAPDSKRIAFFPLRPYTIKSVNMVKRKAVVQFCGISEIGAPLSVGTADNSAINI